MKKAILILILVHGTFYQTFAQQKGKTKHMMISIYETTETEGWRESPNVFITRDDTAQVQKNVELDVYLNTPTNKHIEAAKAKLANHEQQIMQILEPYYNSGWKLVTVSTTKNFDAIFNATRFFFIKDE